MGDNIVELTSDVVKQSCTRRGLTGGSRMLAYDAEILNGQASMKLLMTGAVMC